MTVSSGRGLGPSRRGSIVAVTIAVLAAVACEDPADSLLTGNDRSKGGSRSGGGVGDPNDPNSDPNHRSMNDGSLPYEEAQFRAIEGDFLKKCGNTCHDTGAYMLPAPTFLAGPDSYKSIKSHPGIVVRDVYASAILMKGPHAGPAVSTDPAFEKKVLSWLEAESGALQSQTLPTTPPFTVTMGANDIDLTPACVGGLTGVHLKFEASLVGSMLSLSKLVIVAPAGDDVHVLQPRFIRVLPQANELGKTEVQDPADSFSNSDQTIPGGTEAALSPGSVLFSAPSWRPFDLAKDKLRIEITKLEPGKLSVLAEAAKCKNVQGFVNNVLPSMRGQGGFNLNCSNNNCHGNSAIGNLNLTQADNDLICQQVLGKISQGNIAQSLIVTKPTSNNHGGGQVTNATGWRDLFVNNANVFF